MAAPSKSQFANLPSIASDKTGKVVATAETAGFDCGIFVGTMVKFKLNDETAMGRVAASRESKMLLWSWRASAWKR